MDSTALAVLTSGGDAPGMNAALRSVVRMAAYRSFDVVGFRRGFTGLLQEDAVALLPRGVANVLQRGGTILKTDRCAEFLEPAGRERARRVLEARGISALIIIGGDGSFRGAHALGQIWPGRIIGVPATIDNDIWGTDETIGFDTALNTALEAIDRIRDTASSHDRLFLVEVMGRSSGFIALDVATAGGAEEALVPESISSIDDCCQHLMTARASGKAMSILIIAEGHEEGDAFEVARKIEQRTGLESRVTVLGHIQRGGRPTARDRILATKLGAFAVEAIVEGKNGVMVGEVKGELVTTPLESTWSKKKPLDPFLKKLLPILAK
ncbi:MAG TPA: 6-phosphofructokinase [Vicinamibacteria bacterium]|nr:6-phosphofructokinase [Vicinamibacteria bacterium]